MSCFQLHLVKCSGFRDVSYLASVLVMSDDLPDLRASHGDRDRVVDALRVAAGDGRLDAEELDTRLERALDARRAGRTHR
ncbi:DUF1707 SHOCT-like domain-containing protein [Sphaerisporangium viridialbum]|uniref:DUF1707 SHOCT-like domain-containing protein n=1 Tax=Sphaerisporangium viridialbum TaxID=46189 RepID=UPI003C712E8A